MTNLLRKDESEILIQPAPITYVATYTSPSRYRLQPSREPDVFYRLQFPLPIDPSSGSVAINPALLNLSLPHEMLNDVWSAIDSGTWIVFVRGFDIGGTPRVWNMYVPESWMEVVGGEVVTETITYTPPPRFERSPNPGWDAGAVSSAAFSKDGSVSFSAVASIVQGVVGLNELSGAADIDYLSIDYAFYLTRGVAQVMENGLTIPGTQQVFTDASVFSIVRTGSKVTYLIDDVLVYTSLKASAPGPTVLDASLYYGGDTIRDAALVALGYTTDSLSDVGNGDGVVASAVSTLSSAPPEVVSFTDLASGVAVSSSALEHGTLYIEGIATGQGNFIGSSILGHGNVEVGGQVVANGSFIGSSALSVSAVAVIERTTVASASSFVGVSGLVELRTALQGVESLGGVSALGGTPREPQGMAASLEPLRVLAGTYANGSMDASLEHLEVVAYGTLLSVSLGGANMYLQPLSLDGSGLTGGNSLNTTMEITPLAVLASGRLDSEPVTSYASMDASLEELSLEAFSYYSGSLNARPEVKILIGNVQGSGTLLHTGRHILTAAHVVYDFVDLITDAGLFLYGADVLPYDLPRAASVTIHPDYTGDTNDGNDLAIIELTSKVTWARGREIYQGLDAIGQEWSAISFHPLVDPITGGTSAFGAWHSYTNKFDANEVAIGARLPQTLNVPVASMLASDFDDGTPERDAFGVVLGISDLGTGVTEGMGTPGASGSARMFGAQIASVLSFIGSTGSSADLNPINHGTYGDFEFSVNVSLYTTWIEEVAGSLTFGQDYLLTVPAIATAELGGFLTVTTAQGTNLPPNSVSLTGFSTSILGYTGASAQIGGLTKSLAATGTMDAYGTANLGSFSTTLTAQVYTGAAGRANLGLNLNTDVQAFTGAQLELEGFSSTLTAHALVGSRAVATIPGFTSSIAATGSALDYAVAIIRPPVIGMMHGIARLTGFSTQLFSENKLVVSTSVAYAMNMSTMETTQYAGYTFDYIMRLAGNHYGVKPDGLYLLGGADDAGVAIDGIAVTHKADFETAKHKRVPFVYIDSDGPTNLTSIVDGVRKNTYLSKFGGRRTKLGRGPKGRFWEFEIANVNGGELKVGSLEAYAEELNRKV